MNDVKPRGAGWRLLTLAVFAGALLPLASLTTAPALAATAQELHQGERIYREGILPGGERLRASLKGEPAAPGLTFTCASCHLRSGLGALDDGIYVPPVNGEKLFKPAPKFYKGIEQDAADALRPAYTDESLAELLRSGKDPNGKTVGDGMPRYQLADKDMRLLIAYLKTLSTQFSPGVTDTGIKFATIVSDNVPREQSEAMLTPLNFFVNLKNGQLRSFSNPRSSKSRLMAENMFTSRELASKSLSLLRWTLTGPPESWRAQLEEYNRKEPVFAVVGGRVQGPWQPVHQFCEQNKIPCLFPDTDLPVLSDKDWYTLYPSKGYFQEGESAAHFLIGKRGTHGKGKLVQIVRKAPQGQALSAGFQKAWRELGQKPPVTVFVPEGQPLSTEFLRGVLQREKPAQLVVWDDASALPGLEVLKESKARPEVLLLSGRYLGDSLWELPEPLRGFTYLTYPRIFQALPRQTMGRTQIPADQKPSLRKAEVPIRSEVQRITAETSTLTQLLTLLLMDMKGNYYRDNLLDVAGMMADQPHPLYGRLSFGAGQRYASRGCYIVQLSPGPNPELVKKSGWSAQ